MTAKTNVSRRDFINNVTKTVAGVGVLAATTQIVKADPYIDIKHEQLEVPKSKGYQRTEHVNTYYKLADF